MKSRTALLKTRRVLLALGLIGLIGVRCGGNRSKETADSYWTMDKIDLFNKKYGLHDKGYHHHYPRKSFLRYGYYPPGGYVKDFSILHHDQRWHVFHIDGRCDQICWIIGMTTGS